MAASSKIDVYRLANLAIFTINYVLVNLFDGFCPPPPCLLHSWQLKSEEPEMVFLSYLKVVLQLLNRK